MNPAAFSGRMVDMVSSARSWPWQLPPERYVLASIIDAMVKAANLKDSEIQIRFVSDAEMAVFNEACLSCLGPTNVLTFPRKDDQPGGIAISLDCLRREAMIYGQNPLEYLIRLLAHGFGHLGDLEHGVQLDEIQAACEKAGLAVIPASQQLI